MEDILLRIGKKSPVGQLLQRTGIPMPQALRRFGNQWPSLLLNNKKFIVHAPGLHSHLADPILSAGGEVFVSRKDSAEYQAASEKYSRPVIALDELEDSAMIDGLVFSVHGKTELEELHKMFHFAQKYAARIKECGRLLMISDEPANLKPEAAALHRSLEGFIRSFAKEFGSKGITANILYLEGEVEKEIGGPVTFFLSDASAFVDAQPLVVQKTGKGFAYDYSLSGKKALVTGAARGIGAAIAETLANRGAHVICLDRPDDDMPLAKVARKIHGSVFLQDILEEDAPEKIAAYVKEKHGGIDILVNNAGVTRDKTFKKMSESQWKQVIGVNLVAPIKITQTLFADGLNENGRVVCLSSIAGIAGNFGQTNYATAKAGLIGFVRSFSKEAAKKGVTVNAVAPGFIETRMTAAIPFLTQEAGRRLSMLGQGGLPQDIANTIGFLISEPMQGVNGQVLRICGGSFLGA